MSLFDIFRSSDNNSAQQPSGPGATRKVVLLVNENTLEVDANGKTVAQLFTDYADELGAETTTASRFLSAGIMVSGDSTAEPGYAYRLTQTVDDKG